MSSTQDVRYSESDGSNLVAVHTKSSSRSAQIPTCPSDPSQVGSGSGCQGCPGQAFCLSEKQAIDPLQEPLRVRLGAIKRIVLVMSGKGGVGKSSMCAQLALCAASTPSLPDDHLGPSSQAPNSLPPPPPPPPPRVGILDIDICGPSMARIFGVEARQVERTDWGWQPVIHPASGILLMSAAFLLPSRTDPVMWRGPRKSHLIRRLLADVLWGRLDWLFIDTPPGTSDEHLTILHTLRQFNPNGCVLVSTPQQVASSIVRRQQTLCRSLNLPILGLIQNMAAYICPCCGDAYDLLPDAADHLKSLNLELLGKVPFDPAFCQSIDSGTISSPLASFHHLQTAFQRLQILCPCRI